MRKFSLILLFLNQLVAFASFEMNENIKRSYNHIINLEFEEANIFLNKELSQNPNNGFISSHKNYIDFLTILITEDSDYFDSHESYKDVRLALLDKSDKLSPYYLYLKAEINLQWAISRLKFKQYPTAAYELIRSYRLLKENKEKFPEFTLKLFGFVFSPFSPSAEMIPDPEVFP